jgi:D-glycero-D-manno-heptose 1,7-bisphosphate phosphatase
LARRLVILDRDGVINHDSDEFVKTPDEWLPIDGSIAAIGRLSNAGFTVAVATNQSGIGRKLLDKPALNAMHEKLRSLVKDAGGDVRHYGVPLDGVPIVGDSERDLVAARAMNARPILVLTGKGTHTAADLERRGEHVETFADLDAAASQLIAETRKRAS